MPQAPSGATPTFPSLRPYASGAIRRYSNFLQLHLDAEQLAPDASNAGAPSACLRSEFDVFTALGLRFIPPSQRNIERGGGGQFDDGDGGADDEDGGAVGSKRPRSMTTSS